MPGLELHWVEHCPWELEPGGMKIAGTEEQSEVAAVLIFVPRQDAEE